MTEQISDLTALVVGCATDQSDDEWIPIKPMCQALGVDPWDQMKKLRADNRFNCRVITSQAGDGKRRPMLHIRKADVFGWLMSVNSKKVKPELQSKLKAFQAECMSVLNSYWRDGMVINRRIPVDQIGAVVKEALREMGFNLDADLEVELFKAFPSLGDGKNISR